MLDRLAALAAELVSLKPDVIIALSTPSARAVQRATKTIPIVVGSVGDPVGDGLVASLSHPGGNITGTTFLGPELVAKRFDLLKELIPKVSRVAVLWNPSAFSKNTTVGMVDQADATARGFGLQLRLRLSASRCWFAMNSSQPIYPGNASFRQTGQSCIATASVAGPCEPERRPIGLRRRRP